MKRLSIIYGQNLLLDKEVKNKKKGKKKAWTVK